MTAERENSYVLFPMGETRFALPAEMVDELARPDTLQAFPHCTPLLAGVLVRRGKIVPVWDVATLLVGQETPPRKFYLIANREARPGQDWVAIPVTGECKLVGLKPESPETERPSYVRDVLRAGEDVIDVVDLEKLLSQAEAAR